MAVSKSEADPVTIALADLGCDVPDSVTVDAAITAAGIDVVRNGETYGIERDGSGYTLTGVAGCERLPGRVPGWLEAVAELFGIAEVQLGR